MGASPALTGDVLHIRYVPLDLGRKWDRNPKRHDLDTLIISIVRHGFRDAPIYDETLNAISAGNGRTTAAVMLRDEPDYVRDLAPEWDGKPPAGIALDADGNWHIPMQFGVNAESVAAAEAFAVAHNNLTMSGGDFSFLDIAGMWEREAYAELLDELDDAGELPVGVTDDDLVELQSLFDDVPSLDELAGEHGEPDDVDNWPMLRLKLEPLTFDEYEKLMDAAPGEEEHHKFAALMRSIDYAALTQAEDG